MKLSDFDYFLPKELIAQEPIIPRDSSRLLVLDKKTGEIEHKVFKDILKYLDPKKDVLVFNDTKVIPARLIGQKINGGKQEILLVRPLSDDFNLNTWPAKWRVIGRPGLKVGQEILFGSNLKATVLSLLDQERVIVFNKSGTKLKKDIFKLGQMPLPPYIKNVSARICKKYQTAYALKDGSVAAPTAGFHFTPELLKKIKKQKIQIEYVTLHVGLGTFLPIKEKNILDHKMHFEYYNLDAKTVKSLNDAKEKGKRIIAVGTTACRVLESCVKKNHLKNNTGWTNLYIYPGYHFKFVDQLITNFHLPKSTLLLLVSALATKKNILKAYKEAIKKQYRFFSFGDAMLIK